jgi:hypothetical protein
MTAEKPTDHAAVKKLKEIAASDIDDAVHKVAAGGDDWAGVVRALARDELALRVQRAVDTPREVKRARWISACILVLTVLILSTMLTRVSSTEIALSFKASELGFTATSGNLLLGDGIATQGIELSGIVGGRSQVGMLNGRFQRVSLKADATASTGASMIRITSIAAVGDQQIRISQNAPGSRLLLRTSGPSVQIALTLSGGVTIQKDGDADDKAEIDGRAVTLQGGAGPIEILLGPPLPIGLIFKRDLKIVRLSLMSEPWTGLTPDASQRAVSSALMSGTLGFEEFENKKQILYTGQRLWFDRFDGHVDAIRVEPDAISGVIYGSASSLGSGLEENRTDLMPSRLEWLAGRHELILLWGSALYVFALIIAIVRWLGWST